MASIKNRLKLDDLTPGERRTIELVAKATGHSLEFIGNGHTIRIILEITYSRSGELRRDEQSCGAAMAVYAEWLEQSRSNLELLTQALTTLKAGETENARIKNPDEYGRIDQGAITAKEIADAIEKKVKALKDVISSLLKKKEGKA